MRLRFFHTMIRADRAGDGRAAVAWLNAAMPSPILTHPAASFALLDWKNNLIQAGLPAETA